jgi:hypothetical protein
MPIRWAKQHETAVQTGRYLLSPEASKRTLADLIDRYTEHILPDLPASARDYARHLRWWKEQLGSYYLSDISPRLIDDCKQKLLREPGQKGKRSNATADLSAKASNAAKLSSDAIRSLVGPTAAAPVSGTVRGAQPSVVADQDESMDVITALREHDGSAAKRIAAHATPGAWRKRDPVERCRRALLA